MRKTRVFIWGSCVSRDTFEHFLPDEFELLDYVARQSALSAYTRPVDMIPPPTLESQFQQRQIAGDFTSSLCGALSARAQDVDMLLIDLVDERLGIYLLPDGTVITRSVELIQSGLEDNLPEGTSHLAFGSPKHLEYWTDAIQALGAAIRSTIPRAAVVLLDVPWAAQSTTGDKTPPSFGVDAATANSMFRPYVDTAVRSLGAHVIALDPSEVASSGDHPWGDSPFHYDEAVYLEIVRKLTGSPGRIVWGGRARSLYLTGGRAYQSETADRIAEEFWRYTAADGAMIARNLRFMSDGTIWGNDSRREKDEARWEFDGTQLLLKARTGEISTTLTERGSRDDSIRLEGTSKLHTRSDGRVVLETVAMDWKKRPRPVNSTRALLAAERRKHKWKIGDHTYGKPEIVGAGRAQLEVGKYCWFATSVRLQLSQTRSDSVSLYSFHTTRAFWPNGVRHRPETAARGITIGNDVRIEQGSVICPGVTIGDGALIREGAVVSEDVPPYAVVEGSPGRTVRRRFTEEQIEQLLAIAWWNWPDQDVDLALPVMAEGIDAFLDHAHDRARTKADRSRGV